MFGRKIAGVGIGLASLALVVAGCGNNSDKSPSGASSSTPAVTKDATLAAMVPSSVSSDGAINFGTDASYAPSEFIAPDGTTIEGFDVDLGNAIAAKLGLTGKWQNANFDSLIPATLNGKYDVAMSSFTINSDREKQALMISYYNAGTSWAVAAGNPKNITPDSACGDVVAVQKSTVQVPDLQSRSTKCTKAGKPAITIQQYTLQSDATTAVVSGKADAMLADSPVVAYAIQQTNGKLQKTGDVYEAAPYGIVIPKSAQQFGHAIQGAVQALIDDGTYLQILKKWGVEDGAITTSEISPNVG